MGDRLAFYAPLKSPDHPVASGDRTLARLLMRALSAAGYRVELASDLRSYEGRGDATAQANIAQRAGIEVERLLAHYRALPRAEQPALWFTYHLYHKAPDHIGPVVARQLGIPYVLAEASYAAKQSRGPWAGSLPATREAIVQADAVWVLNPRDTESLAAVRGGRQGLHALAPFLDKAAFAGPRHAARAALAAEWGLDSTVPWLISVGMVRAGDKLASFEMQAAVFDGLRERPWHWLIVGAGDADAALDARLAPLVGRVTRLGALPRDGVVQWLHNADLAVWPAVNEAIGMALLEAQAAGLPVVAGHTDGVAAVCANTGCTVVPQTVPDLVRALEATLDERADWAARGCIAQASVPGIDETGQALQVVLEPLLRAHARS